MYDDYLVITANFRQRNGSCVLDGPKSFPQALLCALAGHFLIHPIKHDRKQIQKETNFSVVSGKKANFNIES